MKATLIVSGVLVWVSMAGGWAQTNVSSPQFSLPAMRLRPELTLDSPGAAPASPFPAHSLETEIPEREVSAGTGETTGALESYNTRIDRFYLVATREPGPESPLGQAFDSIAGPDVVRVGQASLSASVITAVKRKNPLCLLNTTVLKMTW